MKTAGMVLSLIAGLMLLSSVNLALTTYDLRSTHDLSKFLGGLTFAILMLVGGLTMVRKGKRQF